MTWWCLRSDEGALMADQWRSMDLGFRGKVAVVTAASWGIGMVVTQTLADEGTHVVAELGIP